MIVTAADAVELIGLNFFQVQLVVHVSMFYYKLLAEVSKSVSGQFNRSCFDLFRTMKSID